MINICNMIHRNPEVAAFLAFKSIRSRMNRERTKNRPKLPHSITALADELNNYIPMSYVYKGCVISCNGEKALLFSDNKLLQALESSTEIYCDGTFSVSLISIYIHTHTHTHARTRTHAHTHTIHM
jgi:hypothetical protein